MKKGETACETKNISPPVAYCFKMAIHPSVHFLQNFNKYLCLSISQFTPLKHLNQLDSHWGLECLKQPNNWTDTGTSHWVGIFSGTP